MVFTTLPVAKLGRETFRAFKGDMASKRLAKSDSKFIGVHRLTSEHLICGYAGDHLVVNVFWANTGVTFDTPMSVTSTFVPSELYF